MDFPGLVVLVLRVVLPCVFGAVPGFLSGLSLWGCYNIGFGCIGGLLFGLVCGIDVWCLVWGIGVWCFVGFGFDVDSVFLLRRVC